MIGRRGLSSIAEVAAVLAVLTACSNGGPPTTPAGNAVGNNTIATQNYGGQNNGSSSQGSSNQGSASAGSTQNAGSGSNGNGGSGGGSSSSGQTIDIPASAAGGTYTVTCNGDTIDLANAGSVTLTITGHCAEVDVNSGQNQVTVDSADRVVFNGSGNNVYYHCGSPQVTKNGNNNNISQQNGGCGSSAGGGGAASGGGGGASGGEINIVQTGATESDVCNNSKVSIVASDAHVTLTGHCATISIFASDTHVVVDSVDTVTITGSSNDVTYHSGNPDVSKMGDGNNVHQG